MFYVKSGGKKIEVLHDNVFTVCPDCGKEHTVDLADIMKCEDSDLYLTNVCCEKCTARRRLPHLLTR